MALPPSQLTRNDHFSLNVLTLCQSLSFGFSSVEPAKTQLHSLGFVMKKKKNCVFHGIQNPSWLSPTPVQIGGHFPHPKVDKCQESPETWHKLGLHQLSGTHSAVAPHIAGIIPPGYPPSGEAALPPCSHKFVCLEAQGIGMERRNGSLFQSLLGCKMATAEHHQLWPFSSYMDDPNSAALTTVGH